MSRRLLQPHRKKIQIIFQDPYRSLNPRITVGETIAEGPINYGMPRAEALAKARDLLELVDLPPDAISRYPHQFSGGQRQRIAIARALALDPDVLVADEAVSALDVSVQAQVLELLDEIQQRLGIALLFITHDLRVAAQICDDVAVMQHGRIVEQGPAAQVLTHPQQAYTRALDAAPGRGWDFANFRPVVAAGKRLFLHSGAMRSIRQRIRRLASRSYSVSRGMQNGIASQLALATMTRLTSPNENTGRD